MDNRSKKGLNMKYHKLVQMGLVVMNDNTVDVSDVKLVLGNAMFDNFVEWYGQELGDSIHADVLMDYLF